MYTNLVASQLPNHFNPKIMHDTLLSKEFQRLDDVVFCWKEERISAIRYH